MWLFFDWGEGDAAKDFGKVSLAYDGELFFGGCGGVGVGDVVDDGYEAVGVCANVSGTADGGGDAVEDDVAKEVDGAGDVADAVGRGGPRKVSRWVVAGWVVRNGVGDAEFEAGL